MSLTEKTFFSHQKISVPNMIAFVLFQACKSQDEFLRTIRTITTPSLRIERGMIEGQGV